ncbi:hypothetical protein HA402_014651 [Bradysia odoriphaga]|nr:hypothetical protein HA402_014651 [Bradysia odoriphaga]
MQNQAALETVRCEEFQLELSAALKSRSARSTVATMPSQSTVTWAPTPTQHQPITHHSTSSSSQPPTSLHTSMSQQSSSHQQPQAGSEIDRIMAKIEQARLSIANDNRILAELEHPRTTGPQHIPSSSIGSGLTSTIVPTSYSSGNTSGYMGINSMGITSSNSSHALTTYDPTGLGTASSMVGNTSMSANPNVSPLPVRHQMNQMNTMPPLCQSSTMPVLSMHNTYSIPTMSASYTLGLSGAPGPSSYTYPSSGVTLGGVNNILGTGLSGQSQVGGASGLSGLMGTTGLGLSSTNPLSTTLPGIGYNSSSYSTYTNPLLTSGAMNIKLKTYDDLDMIARYGNRSGTTPSSPIPSANWGLDCYSGLDGVNPAFMHAHSRLGGLDLEPRSLGLSLNGTGDLQVDLLDIPGKGRCCVFIARFSYDPPDESEGELSLSAGDYILVWGSGEPQGGYFDAELLDGRRGLVPASYVTRLIGDDLLEFHQAVVSTLRDADDAPVPLDPAPLPPIPPNNPLLTHTSEDMARLCETHNDFGPDQHEDEADTVPAPRHLTLERQLNKSVLIGWTVPEPPGCHQIESYHVYVDGVLKVTVKANERTRALVEGVDCNRVIFALCQSGLVIIFGFPLQPHRISVRSVTQNRRTSRDAACTMIIGRDTAHLGPSAVKAANITCSSSVISWLPANSNHQHVVCVNNVEVRTVKPGVYRHTITGLSPSTKYRVTVRAKHLRAVGQAPPPGPPPEEAPGAYTDFRTLAKGLPDPPQEIQVEAGPQDGTLLVTWQPVNRPPSSGPVTGYAVYADGKKVTDVDSPTGDHALIDIGKLVGLNPRAVTVRTKSRDSQSGDSQPTAIPNVVRNAARNRHNMPHSGLPPHMRNQQQQQQQRAGHQQIIGPSGQMMQNQMQQNPNHQQQQILDHHDENLSDKEVFPGSGSMMQQQHNQMGYQQNKTPRNHSERGRPPNPPNPSLNQNQPNQQQYNYGPNGPINQQQQPLLQQNQQQQPLNQQQQQQQQQPLNQQQQPQQQQMRSMNQRGPNQPNQPNRGQQQQQQQQKKPRFFLALFDYDPSTMSPNPDGCEEELPFQEGDTIKVHGDKDPDGFYWGELRGRRGFVPHNMVSEIEEGQIGAQGGGPGVVAGPSGMHMQSVRGVSRDRWGDIYANMPVKRMIALYDYDPQELSPNVDAEQVELSFKTGEVILVYGEMDEDGFFMGELDGVRGLVPSNFLTEAPEQYNNQSGGPIGMNSAQRNVAGRGRVGPGPGPGALFSGATNATGGLFSGNRQPPKGPQVLPQPGITQQQNQQHQQQQNMNQQPHGGGLFGFGGQQQHQQQQHQHQQNMHQQNMQQQNMQQQNMQQGPNLMQKLGDITAPGSDMLSKGKELIFMKFGLGGK